MNVLQGTAGSEEHFDIFSDKLKYFPLVEHARVAVKN